MAAPIRRLDPHRTVRSAELERLREVVELASELGLSDSSKAEIANAIHRLEQVVRPEPAWTFVMISREQVPLVIRAIETELERPAVAQRVFFAALARLRWDTGEIMADRTQLAEDALTTPREVSRALSAMARIGVPIRHRRGDRPVYFVNPNVGWAGSEAKRRVAAEGAPRLRVVGQAE